MDTEEIRQQLLAYYRKVISEKLKYCDMFGHTPTCHAVDHTKYCAICHTILVDNQK